MRAFELFRKRFTLPVSVLVTTLIILLLLSIVNHTGVATGCPFLLYVSRLIYACPESIDIQLGEKDDDIYSKFVVQLFLLLLLIVFYSENFFHLVKKLTCVIYIIFINYSFFYFMLSPPYYSIGIFWINWQKSFITF